MNVEKIFVDGLWADTATLRLAAVAIVFLLGCVTVYLLWREHKASEQRLIDQQTASDRRHNELLEKFQEQKRLSVALANAGFFEKDEGDGDTPRTDALAYIPLGLSSPENEIVRASLARQLERALRNLMAACPADPDATPKFLAAWREAQKVLEGKE